MLEDNETELTLHIFSKRKCSLLLDNQPLGTFHILHCASYDDDSFQYCCTSFSRRTDTARTQGKIISGLLKYSCYCTCSHEKTEEAASSDCTSFEE